jgi:hypothetical protein
LSGGIRTARLGQQNLKSHGIALQVGLALQEAVASVTDKE